MHQHLAIPSEVIDVIVYEVAQDPDNAIRNGALSSVALCSWAFRHFAHKHLFAEVDLHGSRSKSATQRIRRLLKLMHTDPHSAVTGIASYIRSFSLHMIGTASMVRPTLDDGTMANLFRKLFNTGEPGSGDRSLSLTFGITGNLRWTFDWTTLNHDFLNAFHELCRKPLFTTLHLSRFINLQPNLLTNTAIRSVKLSQIRLLGTQSYDFTDPPTFVSASDEELAISDLPFQKDQVVFLESIDVDQSFPLLEVLDMTPRRSIPPAVVFSKLKNLTLQIQSGNDLEKAASLLSYGASSLEHLEVNLGYHQHAPEALDCAQLPSLKSLTIKHSFISYKSPGISMIRPICCLLSQPLPTLQRIEITLFLFTGPEDRSVLDIFEGHDFAMLDELFSHPKFYCLKHLSIYLIFNLYTDKSANTHQFEAEASTYVRGAFPEVNAVASTGPLEFDVVISPLLRHVK